ncbi:1275_t:CDS:2, partial [Gigaspora rosea]
MFIGLSLVVNPYSSCNLNARFKRLNGAQGILIALVDSKILIVLVATEFALQLNKSTAPNI